MKAAFQLEAGWVIRLTVGSHGGDIMRGPGEGAV